MNIQTTDLLYHNHTKFNNQSSKILCSNAFEISTTRFMNFRVTFLKLCIARLKFAKIVINSCMYAAMCTARPR